MVLLEVHDIFTGYVCTYVVEDADFDEYTLKELVYIEGYYYYVSMKMDRVRGSFTAILKKNQVEKCCIVHL